MATKKEIPVEGEIVDESKTNTYSEKRHASRGSKAGIFWGLVLLAWGLTIFIDTYFHTDLRSNLWPVIAIVFGIYLISSSFNR